MKHLLTALFLAAAVQASAATEKLVSTTWLRQHLRDRNVVVIEVGKRADYEAAHIAGARLVALGDIVVSVDGTLNELPDAAAIERAFRNAGVRNRGRIVLYARDVISATRAFFTLDYAGRGDDTSILDGGFEAWTAEKLPVEDGPPPALVGDFEVRPNPDAVVRLNAMRTLAQCAPEMPGDVSIIDTRPAEAYRSGRISCAVNVPWNENLTPGPVPTFRPIDELRALYREAGLADSGRAVTYCRTGMQASVAYFVLRYLGRDVHLYDGSYSEWSKSQ